MGDVLQLRPAAMTAGEIVAALGSSMEPTRHGLTNATAAPNAITFELDTSPSTHAGEEAFIEAAAMSFEVVTGQQWRTVPCYLWGKPITRQLFDEIFKVQQ